MHDKIIARRHNAYRLRAATVVDVDPGKGPLLQAGIGPATMERISLQWDDGDLGEMVRRFPVEVQPGQRLYALHVESGVSVHPERPIFLFNAGNGGQHREVNAPSVRSRGQLITDRLPLMLAAVVVGAFMSIYWSRTGSEFHYLVSALEVTLAGLLLAWVGLMVYDVRQNRRRAERLEDELSAAKEAVEVMNQDIAYRLSAPQAEQIPREDVGG